MGGIWKHAKSFGRHLAVKAGRMLAWTFFTLSCLVTMVICLGILARQAGAKEPSGTVISTAGGLILVCAMLARHNEAIASRLKKLGPLELFEEVHEALAQLDDIASKVPVYKVSEDDLELKPATLSPAERFAFIQADLVASMLQLGGGEPTRPASLRRYYELLFKVGTCALSQKQWPGATARLERLEEVSGGTYKQRDVLYRSGAAYWNWGRETGGSNEEEKRRYFERARCQLGKLIDLGNVPPAAHFFLAYAQDELGQWHEAVGNNREMLRRRPRCAPAKYNCATSLIKLRRLDDAYKMLEQLTIEDSDLDLVLAVYKDDPDLLPWIKDPHWQQKILHSLRAIEQQWSQRPQEPST
jgi:tetratricopeptide (TPR) repeat protein